MAGAEDVADRAWLRLGHRSENQAIVFLYVFHFNQYHQASCKLTYQS